ILPLTDYIKNSQFYGSFDSDLLKLMTDDNGDIWGVPIDTAQSMFDARGYKKSWLEASGLQVPYTTDEFYEVMSAFTYGDPDGNGQDDTFGYYGPYNFKFALNDILKAYGMYNGSTSFIAYNPNTGTIEDSLLSPDASTALNFINKLYAENLVRISGLSPGVYNSVIPDNCGSILWGFTAEDNIEYAGVPLTATNTANLVNVTTYGRVYFMLSGTGNPESMFNSFVKLFYGNEEAYLMLKYGIPGRHFEIDDANRAVIVNNKSITNENIGKIVIGSGLSVKGDLLLDMAGTLATFPADDYRIFYNELVADADYESYVTYQRNQKQAYINQIISSTYRVPTKAALVQSEFIDNWTIKIKDDYSYYRDLEQAVIGERIMSVGEALEAYRTNMRRLGMQELIDEANLNLGKTSVYKY
ncbi:MAG: hypothetical protein JXB33_02600, partial [Clostridia bacterium]|nr:hypothetical protein [Clostridia bacterium]